MGFARHQRFVIASMAMKVLAVTFQLVFLLAITVSQIHLIFVLVIRAGKAEFVINQFAMSIVVHKGIV